MTRITGQSYVLAVPDAARTARWWTDVMGFRIAAEPEGWTFVALGSCQVRLGSCPDAPTVADIGDHGFFGYIEVADVDAYHATIAARGADILFPPTDQPWGMREAGVRTPDGHRFMIAQEI